MESKPTQPHKIDARSLVDRVYDLLLNRILEGDIRYGEQIHINRVADELNVSTMPVREAIKRLAFEQIVDIKPRSKCQVKTPTEDIVREIYEIREVFETYALSKAIKTKIDPHKIESLRSITDQMRAVRKEKNRDRKEKLAIKLDRQFHTELCKLARNNYFNRFYRQLSLLVNMTLIHQKTYYQLESQYYETHAAIVTALSENPRSAPKALKVHFDAVKAQLFKNFSEP